MRYAVFAVQPAILINRSTACLALSPIFMNYFHKSHVVFSSGLLPVLILYAGMVVFVSLIDTLIGKYYARNVMKVWLVNHQH